DRRELPERADVKVAQALAHVAARQIDVLAREGVHDVARGELAREQPVAPQVDVDLAVDAAPDLDRADAGNLLEPPHQIALENPRELRERTRGARAQDHDRRLVRVELADLG